MTWQIKCDKIVILKSNLVSHCQKLAQQTLWHRKDVDMTACTDAESLCKYSTRIKTESHPLGVRSCHLRHFAKPRLRYLSDISWKKLFFTCIFLLCYTIVLLVCSGWCWTFLPLAYYPPVKCLLGGLVWFFFWGKTANRGLKIWITQFGRKECEMLFCPKLGAKSV